MFVCFFGGYRHSVEFFTHMETLPLPVKGCKLWPMLGTLGHWAVRIINVPHQLRQGPMVLMVIISENPWHSHLLPSVWQWSCYFLFLRLTSVATGDRTPIEPRSPACEANALPLRHRGGELNDTYFSMSFTDAYVKCSVTTSFILLNPVSLKQTCL